MNLVLANVDYSGGDGLSGGHTSDEGSQLQRGLEHAGWKLVGAGYGDGCRDVPTLLDRYVPEAVFVQDPRDWDPEHDGSFRKDVGFHRIEALRSRPDIFRVCIVKDAGSVRPYQERCCREIGPDAVLVYYAPATVLALNPWLATTRLIRIYHSVDGELCRNFDLGRPRRKAVVTGATSAAYPVRTRVMREAAKSKRLGIDVVGHPGYHNRGAHTPDYLAMLAGYRVHVATASIYGFALRKIIESVAVGCTPVTNLPASDPLPEIDGALVRVSSSAGVGEVMKAVDKADRAWQLAERLAWAELAQRWYDWRAAGVRLNAELEQAAAAGAVREATA